MRIAGGKSCLSGSGSGTGGVANPCLVVTADGRLKMEKAAIEEPGPDEVLLHIRATGICGSDMHFWQHGRIGDIAVESDCILGHEAAGVVVKVGSGVGHVKKGDRVAVEPGVPCGHCFLCTNGRYNLCQKVAFAGVYPDHGTIQRFKRHAASHVHKLPDNVSLSTAALIEPLSVALHALRTSPITLGAPVAVFGAGPIGLLAMAVARASGAHPIVISDIDASRLRFAQLFEPSCIPYQVRRDAAPCDSGREMRALFAHRPSTAAVPAPDPDSEYDMPQLVLECTGTESSIATAAYTVRRGGCINVVGVSPKMTIDQVPFMHLSLAEIKLLFINRYHDTWPAALRAIEGNLIRQDKLESMVTHKFALDDAVAAMELVASQQRRRSPGQTVVKVQIVDDSVL
ncbi:hypothetical protein CDD82_2599 [Ophiocordyceps australis]|uniref:Enoyl reductase (ER) domain-containing protein n=1 Tax=Ophiocordyceps australis TaxID=1399860 RepID=A0A2C5XU47_9HYPO|nr:hypothetical protein CDD82_2599 [Ophiocordyceps australis]